MHDASASMAEAAALSFGRESDPELAAAAMPFALKTLDMLAIENPDQADIQLAAARAYIQYSNAFLDWEARKIESDDAAAAQALRQRAARLYLRGRDYAIAALGIEYPDLMEQLTENPDTWLSKMKAADVTTLYWLGAGWASAVAVDPSNMDEVANVPLIEKIMRRALALKPDAELGAIHEFFIAYEGSRSPAMGGDPEKASVHFQQALEISGGKLASPYVSLALSLMIQNQDAARFRELMNQALAIDIESEPDLRLANTLAREKARWYLEHMYYFFLMDETETP
jgi:predicted anti-sigma-YlaC factor YlaD